MVKLVHLLNSPCPPFEGEGVILVVVKCTSLSQKCIIENDDFDSCGRKKEVFKWRRKKEEKKKEKNQNLSYTLCSLFSSLCVCVYMKERGRVECTL